MPGASAYRIGRYPELIEFRVMLEGVSDQPWHGRCFFCVASKDQERTTRTLWLKVSMPVYPSVRFTNSAPK